MSSRRRPTRRCPENWSTSDARHADPNQNIRGGFTNRADFIVSSPGQSLYRWRDVDRLAIAVVDALPFRIEIVEPKVPIVQNGAMNLKIVAQRQEGFTAPIAVELPFRPPGIGAASSVTIPEGQTEVLYPLSAAGNAQAGKWRVFALGSADVNGPAWASSQLATLEVAGPLVTMEMQRTSCEQGQETQVYCKLNQAAPFEGTAKAQLLGLPAKTTAADLEFTKDTTELVFHVKTEPDSPAGKHGNVFCQVTITRNDEPIVARAGGTELQIDQPLPVAANPPPPPPAPGSGRRRSGGAAQTGSPAQTAESSREVAFGRTRTEGESDAAERRSSRGQSLRAELSSAHDFRSP